MESDGVVFPVGAKQVLDTWRTEQDKLNTQRLELVNSLR